MPRFKAARRARSRLPARRPMAIALHRIPRRRVETQTRDVGKGVAVARVDRDPLALTVRAESAEFIRTNRSFHYTGAPERIRNGARTIVSGIAERFVSAAVAVRLRSKLICGPNRALYFNRSIGGCRRNTAAQSGTITRNSGSTRWELIRRHGSADDVRPSDKSGACGDDKSQHERLLLAALVPGGNRVSRAGR